MQKNSVLNQMFATLFSGAGEERSFSQVYKSYEEEIALYNMLFNKKCSANSLVCGRCILSLSRSLVFLEGENETRKKAENELALMEKMTSEKRFTKEQIKKNVDERIKALTSKPSDEITDSLLFLYQLIET